MSEYLPFNDIKWDREIKENGEYKVSCTIPDYVFDNYGEDELIEFITNTLSKLLEV